MCGILLASATLNSAEQVEQAMLRMGYRGTSPAHVVREADWFLGHVRLPIQTKGKPNGGHQPFNVDKGRGYGWSEVAFVGEIFSEDERDSEAVCIADALKSPELYAFHHLDGFWAVAEVQSEGAARVLTDFIGTKPLYYWPGKQAVCSELEPLFALGPRPALDEVYLSNCIKFGYDYSGRTPYEGIRQVAPGTCLTLSPKAGVSPVSFTYWDWGYAEAVHIQTDLKARLDKSILLRATRADKTPALLVSGGLDSSIIYYSLREQGVHLPCFTVENGESEFLPDDARFLPYRLSPGKALKAMQAPLDLGSMVPQDAMAWGLRTYGFDVVLTGDGADELFGGYSRAQEYDSQGSDVFCELPYYHLPRLDRVFMRHTIECRSPFLAPSVIARAFQIPYPRRTSKQVLKHLYKDALPLEVLNRDKHPLKSPAVKSGGLLYRKTLVQHFREHIQNKG